MSEKVGKFFKLVLCVEIPSSGQQRNWFSLDLSQRIEAANVFKKTFNERREQLMMEINRLSCEYKTKDYPIIIKILNGGGMINRWRGTCNIRARKYCVKTGVFNSMDVEIMRDEIIEKALNKVFSDIRFKLGGQEIKLIVEPSPYISDYLLN